MGLFLASLPDGDQEEAVGPGGSLGLSLVLRSSGRGYLERREFPRDAETQAGGGRGVRGGGHQKETDTGPCS